jgi:hypothetical protein
MFFHRACRMAVPSAPHERRRRLHIHDRMRRPPSTQQTHRLSSLCLAPDKCLPAPGGVLLDHARQRVRRQEEDFFQTDHRTAPSKLTPCMHAEAHA